MKKLSKGQKRRRKRRLINKIAQSVERGVLRGGHSAILSKVLMMYGARRTELNETFLKELGVEQFEARESIYTIGVEGSITLDGVKYDWSI